MGEVGRLLCRERNGAGGARVFREVTRSGKLYRRRVRVYEGKESKNRSFNSGELREHCAACIRDRQSAPGVVGDMKIKRRMGDSHSY